MKIIKVLFILSLCSCAHNSETKYVDVRGQAKATVLKMHDTMACYFESLLNHPSYSGIGIFVEDFNDGSIPRRSAHNGPLMDRGDVLFKSYIYNIIPKSEAIIFDDLPLIYARNNRGSVGANKFNFVDSKLHQTYARYIARKLFNNRLLNKINKRIKEVRIFKIYGVFTRNDNKEHLINGLDGRLNVNGNDGNGNLSLTNTSSAKTLGLTMNIVDPIDDSLVTSQSFQITYNSKRKRFRVGLGHSDVRLSSSFTTTEVESPDSAQEVLLQYAALWATYKLYNRPEYLKKCEVNL